MSKFSSCPSRKILATSLTGYCVLFQLPSLEQDYISSYRYYVLRWPSTCWSLKALLLYGQQQRSVSRNVFSRQNWCSSRYVVGCWLTLRASICTLYLLSLIYGETADYNSSACASFAATKYHFLWSFWLTRFVLSYCHFCWCMAYSDASSKLGLRVHVELLVLFNCGLHHALFDVSLSEICNCSAVPCCMVRCTKGENSFTILVSVDDRLVNKAVLCKRNGQPLGTERASEIFPLNVVPVEFACALPRNGS